MALLRWGFLMRVAAALRAFTGRRCNGRFRETHMDALDEILDEDFANEVAVEEAPTEPDAQPRAPDGKFAAKGETESASPAPVEEPAFDHAAVKGERERRKAAEQRAREAEEKLQALQHPAPPPVSLWEDEQQWQQQFGGQVVTTAVSQSAQQSRLIMSEMMASQAFPDFSQVRDDLVQMLNDHPELNAQVANDPHPWAKAYQIAQTRKTMAEVGATDIESLRAAIREEERAKLTQQPPVQIPQSLADAQSSRASAGQAFRPPTLEEILGG